MSSGAAEREPQRRGSLRKEHEHPAARIRRLEEEQRLLNHAAAGITSEREATPLTVREGEEHLSHGDILALARQREAEARETDRTAEGKVGDLNSMSYEERLARQQREAQGMQRNLGTKGAPATINKMMFFSQGPSGAMTMIMNGENGISSSAQTQTHTQQGVDVAQEIGLHQRQALASTEARLEALLGARGRKVATAGSEVASAGKFLAKRQGKEVVNKAALQLGGGDLFRSLMESVVQCGGLLEGRSKKPAVLRESESRGSVSVAELERELAQIREENRKQADRATTSAALLAAQKKAEGRVREETWNRCTEAWDEGVDVGNSDEDEETRGFEGLKTTLQLAELPPLPTFDRGRYKDTAPNHAALDQWTPQTREMETFLKTGQEALDRLEATLEAQRQTSSFLAKALSTADATQVRETQRALEAQQKAEERSARHGSMSGTPGRRRRRDRSQERSQVRG